ncbi:MAG: ABC transporter ATP-binding protein [Actinomycetota bacterium]|nr:ABC transporter ATP-binding protein [Actinomycetota bacterium]
MSTARHVEQTSGREVLRVSDLTVGLVNGLPIIENVSLSVRAGEILGIVGESGSGKTTLGLALLGFARPGVRISGGSVDVSGVRLTDLSEEQARAHRGRLVSYVPQDPAASLNPALRVGDAIADMLREHAAQDEGGEDAILQALQRVDLPGDRRFASRFPHELSGGQQQRVAIAAALVCRPAAVVMDEPTTGLDVVTQARILEEIEHLRSETGLAVVYVSHDLAVVAAIADRIAVMYAGRIVEEGAAREVLGRPRHPYALGLVSSIPDHVSRRQVTGIPGVAAGLDERPTGCAFAPRCAQRVERCEQEVPPLELVSIGHGVRCFEWPRTPVLVSRPVPLGTEVVAATALLAVESLQAAHGRVVAVEDVSFELATGESVALVGESGSGKTTIARCVAGLHAPSSGRILLDGVPLAGRARDRTREQRRRLQIVFQNPYDSLNPRRRIRDEIARPARILRGVSAAAAEREVAELLERVRLPSRLAGRFPAELSGGERQRVAIARALAARPEIVVCDEITSALDVSVQAAVLELLAELRSELGLSLLFISHDLGVVATVADRILVLQHGRLREEGPTERVLAAPSDDYTRRLLEAAPRLPEPGEAA